jgi:hypothetical protein
MMTEEAIHILSGYSIVMVMVKVGKDVFDSSEHVGVRVSVKILKSCSVSICAVEMVLCYTTRREKKSFFSDRSAKRKESFA